MKAEDHSRNKYQRHIHGLVTDEETLFRELVVDVYCVLEAFSVTCPARAHAVKKLLCAGLRGKGDALTDLRETLVAVERAIQLEEDRCRSIAK